MQVDSQLRHTIPMGRTGVYLRDKLFALAVGQYMLSCTRCLTETTTCWETALLNKRQWAKSIRNGQMSVVISGEWLAKSARIRFL